MLPRRKLLKPLGFPGAAMLSLRRAAGGRKGVVVAPAVRAVLDSLTWGLPGELPTSGDAHQ